MSNRLQAGAARRIVNPPIGIKKPGMRLFADPVQGIESDLTATALVLADGPTKVVIIGLDIVGICQPVALEIRRRIGEAVGTPTSHVLINFSHTHSGPALPDFIPDTPENVRVQQAYQDQLIRWLVEVATEASQGLRPARIAADFGAAHIGVYRREKGANGQLVLGEDPSVPIDHSVSVIRVDDLAGQVIAILFSHGCHTVTMGPRSMVASSDYVGPARELIERSFGGLSIFLQACGGNINPMTGIGYEVDCRDTKNRTGLVLGSEVVRVAANLRTHVKRSLQRKPMGTVPNILFWAWEPVEGQAATALAAADKMIAFDFIDPPSLEVAQAIHQEWKDKWAKAQANDERDWVVTVAHRFTDWSNTLLTAVRRGNPPLEVVIQAIRIGEIVLASAPVEAFFETGQAIRAASPFAHTQFLGYANGCVAYLPRAEDYPAGGWKLTERYAVPDLLFQAYNQPVAFRPETEQKMVREVSQLIQQLGERR